MANKRISWDEYWANMVKIVAKRSTCVRHEFGAIIVKDNVLISSGYNGAPKGFEHCIDIGCLRDKLRIKSGTMHEKCMAVHAEQNALLQAGPRAQRATMYTNCFPCKICAKMIINSGIRRVVACGKYSDREGMEFLKKVGIEINELL